MSWKRAFRSSNAVALLARRDTWVRVGQLPQK